MGGKFSSQELFSLKEFLEPSTQISTGVACDNCRIGIVDIKWEQCKICKLFDLCSTCVSSKYKDVKDETKISHNNLHGWLHLKKLEDFECMKEIQVDQIEEDENNLVKIQNSWLNYIRDEKEPTNDHEMSLIITKLRKMQKPSTQPKTTAEPETPAESEARLRSKLLELVAEHQMQGLETKIKVLSLDGGGIRGYMSIKVLMQLITDDHFDDKEEYKEAKEKFKEAKKVFKEGEQKFQDAEEKFPEAKEKFQEAKEMFQEAKEMFKGKKFPEGEQKFQEAEEKFQEAQEQFPEAQEKFQEAKQKFQEAKEKFQEGEKKFQEAEKTFQTFKQNFPEPEDMSQETEEMSEKAKEFQRAQKKFTNKFNYFVGTSTGGLIAFCLAVNYNLIDIVKIYIKNKKYFKVHCNPCCCCGPCLWDKYNPTPIYDKIDGIIKKIEVNGPPLAAETATLHDIHKLLNPDSQCDDTCLRDPLCLKHQKSLIITAYNTTKDSVRVFNTSFADHQNYLIADVLKATMAAPTYFPPCEIHKSITNAVQVNQPTKESNDICIDGGVFANDPELAALWAIRMQWKKQVTYHFLSIGTGTYNAKVSVENWRGGYCYWLIKQKGLVISMFMDSTRSFTERVMSNLAEFNNIKRMRFNYKLKISMDLDDPQFVIEFKPKWPELKKQDDYQILRYFYKKYIKKEENELEQ